MTQKHATSLFILLVVFTIAISGFAFFSLQLSQQDNSFEQSKNSSIQPQVINSDIDTSDWNTYRNEEFGIIFEYPKDWAVSQKENKIIINSADYKMGLAVIVEKTDQTINQFIDYYNSIDPTSKIVSQDQTSLDGVIAIKLLASTSIGLDYSYLFFSHNGVNYLVTYNEWAEIHEKIISTLRLVH